jgi:hypothetical protein
VSDYAKNRANEQHFAHLMSVPAVREGRIKLRDAVPASGKRLDQMARKFASTSSWHSFRDWNKTNKDPIYPVWCRGTPQLAAVVKVPEAWDVVNGEAVEHTIASYIEAFDRLNGLRAVGSTPL